MSKIQKMFAELKQKKAEEAKLDAKIASGKERLKNSKERLRASANIGL